MYRLAFCKRFELADVALKDTVVVANPIAELVRVRRRLRCVLSKAYTSRPWVVGNLSGFSESSIMADMDVARA